MTEVLTFLLLFFSLPALGVFLLIFFLVQKNRRDALEGELNALRDRLDRLERIARQSGSLPEDAPAEAPVTVAPPRVAPEAVTPPRVAPAPPPARTRRRLEESFIGKVLISVAAASLVFIALILLALDKGTAIPDEVRILSIFLLSGLILSAGLFLGRKSRNNFTFALTGCGSGAIFISILLTHLLFERINDVTAFVLLFFWMVFSLFLSKKTDSLLLSVIAHIGMVFSICFAFSLGLSDEKLILLLAYQFASSAVLILGNLFGYRRTYHAGLLVSLALTVVAGAFLWQEYTPRMGSVHALFASSFPTAMIAGAFFLQFLAATYVSYLLSVSAARVRHPQLQRLLQTANRVLWVASAGVNFSLTVYNLLIPVVSGGRAYFDVALLSKERLYAFALTVVATLLLYFAHLAVTVLFVKRLSFPSVLEGISVYTLTGGIAVLLVSFYSFTDRCISATSTHPFPMLLWFTPLALVPLVVRRITKNKAARYELLSLGLALFDGLLYMPVVGYKELMSDRIGILLPLLYLAVPLVTATLLYLSAKRESRAKYTFYFRSGMLIFAELSIYFILLNAGNYLKGYSFTDFITLLVCMAIHMAVTHFGFDRAGDEKTADLLRKARLLNEAALIGLSCLTMNENGHYIEGSEWIFFTFTAIFALAVAFQRIRELQERPESTRLAIYSGAKLTLITLAFITPLVEQGYLVSTVCMLTAFLAIIGGFAIRSRPLRLYGLILTLLAVLKLVLIDTSALATVTRILSFLAGGLICFTISALYTYLEKKLLKQAAGGAKTDTTSAEGEHEE